MKRISRIERFSSFTYIKCNLTTAIYKEEKEKNYPLQFQSKVNDDDDNNPNKKVY